MQLNKALFDFINDDGSDYMDPDELYPVFLRLARQKEPKEMFELVNPVIKLFDDDNDGKWSRLEFGNFLRFQYLCYLLEAEAREVSPLGPKELLTSMVKPMHSKDCMRLYPYRLQRQEVERHRYMSIWTAELGEFGVKMVTKLQTRYRIRKAIRDAAARRYALLEKKSATRIKSTFRGRKGRAKAQSERDRLAEIELNKKKEAMALR